MGNAVYMFVTCNFMFKTEMEVNKQKLLIAALKNNISSCRYYCDYSCVTNGLLIF